MKTLEIVHLRSPVHNAKDLGDQILASIGMARLNLEDVRIYRRAGLQTDLAIHIFHPNESATASTVLGAHLAAALKAYGLVEHTKWEELT